MFVVRVLLSVRCHEHCTHTRRQKSGWRKLGAAQGVSYEIRKNDIIYDERYSSPSIFKESSAHPHLYPQG